MPRRCPLCGEANATCTGHSGGVLTAGVVGWPRKEKAMARDRGELEVYEVPLSGNRGTARFKLRPEDVKRYPGAKKVSGSGATKQAATKKRAPAKSTRRAATKKRTSSSS